MITRVLPFIITILVSAGVVNATPRITLNGSTATITSSSYTARFDGPALTFFKDTSTGEVLIDGTDRSYPFVRLIEKGRSVTLKADSSESLTAQFDSMDKLVYEGRIKSEKADVLVKVEIRALADRLEIYSKAKTESDIEGLASVGFSIGPNARQTEILVPHSGGIRFTSTDNKGFHTFEWPISWEAAMMQVQGKKGGILVSSFDPFTRFKNLELVPGKAGYSIQLETENDAPFEGQKIVDSITWTVRPYSGEWRNGARIYKNWLYRRFKPDIKEEPAWVKDIRAEVHCGLDLTLLDSIAAAGIDPSQTLIYVPSWRTNEYDRNYPDYTPDEKLKPFVEKAHKMGFRIMLHVNYFGCDPKMPEYERFERYQFRHKYSGDKQWWWWTRAEPEIKFAYTNPASKEWRDFFVAKMVEVIHKTGADALHLDQTLCIFNDKNGRIDGLNGAQGNLELHKELKATLPQVAMSGEGLDEVTMIYEAFAQRHAYGIDFVNGSFDRKAIERRHPLCAYLFGDRTIPYQYLGTCSPDNTQLYLAWRDFYRVGGVIPGYAWPSPEALANPKSAGRQALKEIQTFQTLRLTPSMDSKWPEHVNFPYTTKSGQNAAYVSSITGWSLLVIDEKCEPVKEYSRTITGVDRIEGSGSIPGCMFYDSKRIGPLDRGSYYVWFPEPRSDDAFHVESAAGPITIVETGATPDLSWFRTAGNSVITGINELFESSVSYYYDGNGKAQKITSEITANTGSTVSLRSGYLFMHPPWKGSSTPENGFGMTSVKFYVKVPKQENCCFKVDCALDGGAVANSDGVVFKASATDGKDTVNSEVTVNKAEKSLLQVNLSNFAGKSVTIELVVTPGPELNSSFDWANAWNPRVETVGGPGSQCRVVVQGSMNYVIASDCWRMSSKKHSTTLDVLVPREGSVITTSLLPVNVDKDTKLTDLEAYDINVQGTAFAEVVSMSSKHTVVSAVNGLKRESIDAHPPQNGRRHLYYFISSPEGRQLVFEGFAGLRDGSKSDGVTFEIWCNGVRKWSKSLIAGSGWVPLSVTLEEQTSGPIMLTLVTDSEGSYYFDWALWGEPCVVVRPNQ